MTKIPIKYTLVFLLFAPVISFAQTEAEQIEAIKHNIDFVYSDYINKDESIARIRAKESLDIEIERYIERSKDFHSANGVIIKDIVEKAEEIHLQSGTLHRIFLYIKKKNIYPADVISIAVQRQDTTKLDNSVTLPKLEETLGYKHQSWSFSDNKRWKKQFICDILESKSYSELATVLSRGKAEYKVLQIGDEKNIVQSKDIFWVILEKDGRLLALIGPNGNEQINFQTGERDSIAKYNGFKKFWFTLSK